MRTNRSPDMPLAAHPYEALPSPGILAPLPRLHHRHQQLDMHPATRMQMLARALETQINTREGTDREAVLYKGSGQLGKEVQGRAADMLVLYREME